MQNRSYTSVLIGRKPKQETTTAADIAAPPRPMMKKKPLKRTEPGKKT